MVSSLDMRTDKFVWQKPHALCVVYSNQIWKQQQKYRYQAITYWIIETDRVASGERIILQRFLFEAVCHTLGGFSLAVFVCHTCIKMTGDIHGKWLQDHQNDTKFRFYLFSTSAMSTVVLFITCWLKKIVPIRRAASLPFNPLASLVLS